MDFDIEILHPNIWVFKNALKESLELIKEFRDHDDTNPWFTIGTQVSFDLINEKFNSFPTRDEWDSRVMSVMTNEYSQIATSVFYETTKQYVVGNNFNMDNWVFSTPAIAKYRESTDDEVYALSFHTDFQEEIRDAAGIKFAITSVFYLNDDYEGGDIVFRVDCDEKVPDGFTEISYKPKAGDIVIFPSTKPYYHGVNTIHNGEKWIIRYYWKHDDPGTEAWIAGRELYGEEVWQKKEEERIRRFRERGVYFPRRLGEMRR